MPRATTKTDLIKTANKQFDKMWEIINSMSQQQQTGIFNFRSCKKIKCNYFGRIV